MTEYEVVRLDHAEAATAEEIRRVMFDAYTVEAALLEVSDFVPLRRTAEQIAGTDALFLAIHIGDQLAAVAEVETIAPQHRHIGSLVVKPSWFRRGLGSALVTSIIERNPGSALTVSTGARNAPAVALYERQGFHEQRCWSTPDGIPMVTLLRDPETSPTPER